MAAGEIVAVHAVLVLEMADDGLDGGAASHLAFDLWGHAALLLGGVDFELVFGRGVVAAVAGVGVEALDGVAEECLDRRNDAGEGVSVVVPGSACTWVTNWPPLQRFKVVATLTLTPNS